MLCVVAVGLDAVVAVRVIDSERARSFGMVVEPKVRQRENTDLSYVVEYVSGKARCMLVVWQETDMETESNPLFERADLAIVV